MFWFSAICQSSVRVEFGDASILPLGEQQNPGDLKDSLLALFIEEPLVR